MIPGSWKLIAAGALAALLIAAGWQLHGAIWQAGYDARSAEITQQIQESEGLIDEETRHARDA